MEPTIITGPWHIGHTELVDNPPETRDFTATDRMLLGAGWLADAGGNTFESWYYLLQGTNTSAVTVQRRNPAGVITGAWELPPPVAQGKSFKLDSASTRRAGTRIVVSITAHEISSAPERLNLYAVLHLDNVAVDDGGRDLDSLPVQDSVFNAPDPAPTPGDCPSVNDITTGIKAEMNGELGTLVQQKAKNGATDAIRREVPPLLAGLGGGTVPAYLATPDALLAVLKDGLYQWQLDRLFQVLRDNGLIPPHG